MKARITFLLLLLNSAFCLTDAQTCETEIFKDEFSVDGSLPSEWAEYNTSGQVTVDGDRLELDYTADKPSAYRTFTPTSNKVTVSFDVSSTRNWVKAKLNLVSSSGECITGLIIGNDGEKNIKYALTKDASGFPSTYGGALLDGTYASNTIYTLSVVIDFDSQTLSFYQGGELKTSGISFLNATTDIAKIDIQQVSMYGSSGQFYFDNVALSYSNEIFTDAFSEDSIVPTGWTEYNTTGQVINVGGQLELDYISDKPSVYRDFDAETDNLSFSFDVQSTRSWVKCKLNLLSSTDEYITGIIIGNDGVGNIQYATSLDASGSPSSYSGALVDGTYANNYAYTIKVIINFDDRTLSFYQGGEIMAYDIDFLSDASDFAKIDIQQISMYSGEGRFYFDNISLAYQNIDRAGLAIAYSNAEVAIEDVILSPQYGYSEESYFALKSLLTNSESLLTSCDVTELEIEQAETDILDAHADFDASYSDDEVLLLYSGYDFIGTERGYKCGYYNGTLDDFEDIPVSFKLAKGYMATFAQDIDGQGYSKVYIAQDAALEVNFPEELQQSISFMRVSPWYDTQKKGSCGKGTDVMDALEVDWYYAWGMTNGASTAEREFVPMSWSGGSSFSGLAACRTAGQNMAFNHHLGFNEPDLEDQSNMTVARALELWPNLLASGLRLGSPAVSNLSYSATNGEFNDGAWIEEFMDSCVARGYRVDFIAVHDYVRRSPATYITRFKGASDKYDLPVWVTEYNYGNPNVGSAVLDDDVELAKIQAINDKFDDEDFIERYSMFYFQPSQGQLTIFETRTPIVLNDLGEYTRDHISPEPSYLQETYVDGPYIETGIETAIDETENTYQVPNILTANVLRINADVCLTVYDLNGRVVARSIQNTIDISSLSNGLYLLRIDEASSVYSKKVIIQR